MNLEVILIGLLFLSSFAIIVTNPKKSLYVLLGISVLLHKELFSMYSWNILPVRVFMGALSIYVLVDFIKSLKNKDVDWIKKDLLNPATLSLLAFWLIAGISMFFSRNIKASLSVYAFLTTVLGLFVFFFRTLSGDKDRVIKLIKGYILIAFILSAIGYIQIFVFERFSFIFGAFWNIPGHTPRIGSLFWDVNHFAGLLVLLLPVIAALIFTSKWKERIAFFLMGLSISVTLLLTNARSGWVAAGASFLAAALILIFRRFRGRGLAVIFAVLVIGVGVFLSQYLNKQNPIRHEIRQYFHYRLDSFDSHFLLLTGSWQVFEKFPILGGGYGSFFEQFSKTKISATFFARDPAALNTRVPAHSIWGELLSETGILGFTAMLVFYAGVVFTLLYAALRLKNKKEFILCAAMAGSVIGIVIAGVFYSYNSEFFWIVLFLYFLYGLFCLRREFNISPARLWGEVFSHFVSHPKFPVLILFVLSATLIFVDLGKNHLIPWDEAIYAKVSQNILTRGDFVTLSWRDNTAWFEKPPLYFWLSAPLLAVIPSPELAVRLPSAIFGLLSIVVVYAFGRRLFGKTAGFIAGLALLTTFHFLYYARTGMLDVTCSFFILTSLYLFYLSTQSSKKIGRVVHLLLSGVFVGLAVLTKGVVGLLPLPIIFLYMLVDIIDHFSIRRLFSSAGKLVVIALLTAAVFLPWHLKMYQLHGSSFIDSYLGYHVLNRATAGTEDKNAPLLWYFTVLKVSMRLWFVALIPSLLFVVYKLIRNKSDRIRFALVLMWALLIFCVFSFSKSKLIWYIIPIYPALAIIIGYFYSAVLSFADEKLTRLKYISSFVLKSFAIYTTVCVSLLYLMANKEPVYTPDLTGSQAQLLQFKDSLYGSGSDSKVYADRIDLPIMLFYSRSPFEITDFSLLKQTISRAAKDNERVIFITKESRFKKLKEEFPSLQLISSVKEWYLGELPANELL